MSKRTRRMWGSDSDNESDINFGITSCEKKYTPTFSMNKEEQRLMNLLSTDIPAKYQILSLNTTDEIKLHSLKLLQTY